MPTGTTESFRRDRATRQAYVQFGLFGYFFFSFAVTVSLLGAEHGYSRSVAALHGTATALGAITAGLGQVHLVRRVGRGMALRIASLLIVVGVVVYTASAPLPLTLLGAFVGSCGGWLVVVGVNAFLPDHHGVNGPRALAEAQGMGAAFGVIAPPVIGAAVALEWGWRHGLLVVCGALIAVELWRGRALDTFDGRQGKRSTRPAREPKRPLPLLFWTALVVFGLCSSVEFCLALWSSSLLRDRAGLGDAAAVASLATVLGGLTIGRLGGSVLVGRFEADRLLMATMTLSIVGMGVAWSTTSTVGMLIGLTIAGIGLGLQAPLAVGRSLIAAGSQVDRASGMTVVGLGIANGIAPFLLAALADAFGVHLAFLTVPALVALALLLVATCRIPAEGPSDSGQGRLASST